MAYDAIPSGILKSSLTTTPALASINLSSITDSISSLSTALSTAQAAIIADTGATQETLSTALSTSESTTRTPESSVY